MTHRKRIARLEKGLLALEVAKYREIHNKPIRDYLNHQANKLQKRYVGLVGHNYQIRQVTG